MKRRVESEAFFSSQAPPNKSHQCFPSGETYNSSLLDTWMYSYTYTSTLPITTGVTKQFFWGVTFHLQTGGAPYCTGFAMNIYIFLGG